MHIHQIPKGLRYARCRRGHHKWVMFPESLYRDDKTEIAGVCARCEVLAVWNLPRVTDPKPLVVKPIPTAYLCDK